MIKVTPLLFILFISVFAFQKDANGQFGSISGGSLNILYPQPATSLYNTKAGDLNFAYGNGGYSHFAEVAYSPIKHISVQANYLNYKVTNQLGDAADNVARIGLGGYYFFNLNRLRDRKEKVNPNIGMNRGFLFDGNFNFGLGQKDAIFMASTHKASFYAIGAELGLHYFGKLTSLHFTVNRNLISYQKYTIVGNTPDPVLDVADLLKNDRNIELITLNMRQTFGTKQARLYFNFNLPILKAGDAQHIQNNTTEVFRNGTAGIGLILNLNTIFNKDFILGKLNINGE